MMYPYYLRNLVFDNEIWNKHMFTMIQFQNFTSLIRKYEGLNVLYSIIGL